MCPAMSGREVVFLKVDEPWLARHNVFECLDERVNAVSERAARDMPLGDAGVFIYREKKACVGNTPLTLSVSNLNRGKAVAW